MKKDTQRRMSSFDSNSPEFVRVKSISTKKVEKSSSNPMNLGDKGFESGAGRQLTMNDNRRSTKEANSPAGVRTSLLSNDAQQAQPTRKRQNPNQMRQLSMPFNSNLPRRNSNERDKQTPRLEYENESNPHGEIDQFLNINENRSSNSPAPK